ncbi:hypothetical protein H5410_051477 [Solanum commersonii]|uniref:Uncharacterized protein n=1 Tax=Solanum commersonii TaxID=4109 RepID=A0A9J5WYJ1_SOLCO|nr:hypothetical protein H5410_051477 [Solanum commersonii]
MALTIKDIISAEPSKGRGIYIRARVSGLAAARKVMVYKKDRRGNKVTVVDLGGIVLTGTLGNPPGLLALQLSYTLHKMRDQCPLYRVDGKPVHE